jgi:hypothetical protein
MNRGEDKWKEVDALNAVQPDIKKYFRGLKCNERAQNDRSSSQSDSTYTK